MDNYLDSMRAIKFLSADEEAVLFGRAMDGDVGARNVLVESVLPWVVTLVKRFVRERFLPGVEFEDLMSVGSEAVVLAVDGGFDPSKGRLTTYVTRKVFWALDRFCKENRSVVKVPSYLFSEPDKVRDGDLVGRGGVLDGLDFVDDGVGEWEEFGESLFVDLFIAVGELVGDVGIVIKSRLDGKTLKDIGDNMGLSKERVRQLQEKGIGLLRKKLMKKSMG